MIKKVFLPLFLILLAGGLVSGLLLARLDDTVFATPWILVSLKGHEVVPMSYVTARFSKSERSLFPYTSGNAGCNTYYGSITTLLLCDLGGRSQIIAAQEDEYLRALEMAKIYHVAGGSLELKSITGKVVLKYRQPQPGEVELANINHEDRFWELQQINGHAPVPGSTISAQFGFDNPAPVDWIEGSTGCNFYRYAIELNDQQLKFASQEGVPVVIPQTCDRDAALATQETEYIGALHSIASYQIIDGRLELKNEAGEVVLSFSRSG